jgi:hypothetical protein
LTVMIVKWASVQAEDKYSHQGYTDNIGRH